MKDVILGSITLIFDEIISIKKVDMVFILALWFFLLMGVLFLTLMA